MFPPFSNFLSVDTGGKTDMLGPGKSLLTGCVSTETLNAFEKVLHLLYDTAAREPGQPFFFFFHAAS